MSRIWVVAAVLALLPFFVQVAPCLCVTGTPCCAPAEESAPVESGSCCGEESSDGNRYGAPERDTPDCCCNSLPSKPVPISEAVPAPLTEEKPVTAPDTDLGSRPSPWEPENSAYPPPPEESPPRGGDPHVGLEVGWATIRDAPYRVPPPDAASTLPA